MINILTVHRCISDMQMKRKAADVCVPQKFTNIYETAGFLTHIQNFISEKTAFDLKLSAAESASLKRSDHN